MGSFYFTGIIARTIILQSRELFHHSFRLPIPYSLFPIPFPICLLLLSKTSAKSTQ
ncbi:MAG: hypothetical protein F6K55_13200 [Moorea sp. SIO4A3]|nr:hypothetical protein [Moorena sp. SIO4A3]